MTGPWPAEAAAVLSAFTRPRRRLPEAADLEAVRQATRGEFTYRGLNLASWIWGQGGPAVWLVHGWESRTSHLWAFVEPLRRMGCQVVAFDAPGHGDSEGSVTHAIDYARAIQCALRELPPPAALVSHSAGATAVLLAFVEGLQVRASVQLATPASYSSALRRAAWVAGLAADVTTELLGRVAQLADEPVEVMDVDRAVKDLRHRALFLHDPEDREIPFSDSEVLARNWPGAELRAVRGVGHRRILRDPSVIDAAVTFLSSCGLSEPLPSGARADACVPIGTSS